MKGYGNKKTRLHTGHVITGDPRSTRLVSCHVLSYSSVEGSDSLYRSVGFGGWVKDITVVPVGQMSRCCNVPREGGVRGRTLFGVDQRFEQRGQRKAQGQRTMPSTRKRKEMFVKQFFDVCWVVHVCIGPGRSFGWL